MAASTAVTINGLRAAPITQWTLHRLATIVAGVYSLVAAIAFASSRLGIALFGIGEPIVELTAVHYTYAGSAALVLAAHRFTNTAGTTLRIAVAATVLTALTPPIVATGFVTHAGGPQVGGAALMAIGVWLTASLELRDAFDRRRPTRSRGLLAVSGIAIWAPILLAVAIAWAAGQHWDVPALSIPDMERTHGIVNALAFVVCGLVGRRISRGPSRVDVGVLPRARVTVVTDQSPAAARSPVDSVDGSRSGACAAGIAIESHDSASRVPSSVKVRLIVRPTYQAL